MKGVFQRHTAFIIKALILIVFSTSSHPLWGQNSENWIDAFSQDDKLDIEQWNTSIADIDGRIYEFTGSFNNDTILKINHETDSLTLPLNQLFMEKNSMLQALIQMYDGYIDATTIYLDSLAEYRSNAEVSITLINENKGQLAELTEEISGEPLAQNKALIEKIKLQETIVIFQKQYFTFFSLSNAIHLIHRVRPGGESTNQDNAVIENNTPAEKKGANTEYVNVIINNQIVESIQVSIKEYVEDPELSAFTITNFDMEQIEEKWNTYVYDSIPETSEIQTAPQSSSDTLLAYEPREEVLQEEVPNALENNSQPVEQSELPTQELPNQNENETSEQQLEYPIENDNEKYESTTPSEHLQQYTEHEAPTQQLQYRIQIAASKIPLTEKKITSRYSGSRPVKMFEEEGWYKYYIAETGTLKEAILIKKESQVPDAFIMAYSNGVKVKYYLKYSKVEEGSVPPDNFIDLKSLSADKLVIVIQVAADKIPLSPEKLSKLYQGGKPLNYLFENGWHKYSFGNFSSFWPANIARRKCGVEGAFVAAYKNGEKIDLWADSQHKK